ncbi:MULTISPECIES: exonuclease domain-containing protein [Bacillaceae]|uniref:exonuclease domain-containing protein n=1 Tax=Bacillaceae TaxID=186817 RepID=UPI001E4E8D21|nr:MULTISPECIES: exonuclease domain-containing protein [Bacillaceae]MCE4049653.1 3'-5' exoribonuclease [Bacillus sp. Au-Bac7]MCM3031823.1 exonuclease domain-containing protein [Niallia sp. MER 6]MDL0436975.1 exonuclease domain-containing protein [Niallia sp. SS-2023]UPO87423.1 3'-5' exoribonuclease [Niallia sp. Man26]
MDFIAIDFEIANEEMDSACSVGLAYVENNRVVKTDYYLIKPPVLKFNERFIRVHGITAEDVMEQPAFDQVWKQLESELTGQLLVAHNAQFDMSVLHSCLARYNLKAPQLRFADSISISTAACRGEGVRQSLKARTARFGVMLENHHHAGADAIACAELVIACVKAMDERDLDAYLTTNRRISVKPFSALKPQISFSKKRTAPKPVKKFNSVAISEIAATTETFDETHALFGKNVVFTGDLATLDRKEAMQKVVDAGGLVKSGVSGKTNFLVVGVQDKQLVGASGISTKEKKAFELQEKGQDIQIVNEEQFLRLIDGKNG